MKIDILAKPEEKIKMEKVSQMLRTAALNVKVPVVVNFSNNFAAFAGKSYDPLKTPIVFIEGNAEFSGDLPSISMIQKKLLELKEKKAQSQSMEF